MMNRLTACGALVSITFSGVASAQSREPVVLRASAATTDAASVVSTAPIYVLPDATREPIRIAAEGSSLAVIDGSESWTRVAFDDPQYGRRVGYIQTKYLRPGFAPVAAAPGETPAARSSRSAATPQPPRPVARVRPPAPAKYRWMSAGLLAAGAACFLVAPLTGSNAALLGSSQPVGPATRALWLAMGGGLAAAGAAIYETGSRRAASTQVALIPGGVAVQKTITSSPRR